MHSLKLEANYNTCFPQICRVSSQYVQSNTLSLEGPVATHPDRVSEISLPPHEIETILRMLIAAATNLASHQRRPGEKDPHLSWRRVDVADGFKDSVPVRPTKHCRCTQPCGSASLCIGIIPSDV